MAPLLHRAAIKSLQGFKHQSQCLCFSGLHDTYKRFFIIYSRYLTWVIAVIVCLSVCLAVCLSDCHKLVFCNNG